MRSFSTSVAPGAAHAVEPANSRSLQDLTCPVSVTLPPSATTLMPLGSNQERCRAAAMSPVRLLVLTLGFSVI